ncbi:MAG: hypothetical protein FWE83_04140 [Oscillospiraceae bacterium]|nr:hypothetical protein [Oscillospiraceae bacterium]
MKKRIFTLALVVLFALTLMPLLATADDNLHKLDAPSDFEGSGHWGWSMSVGTLPGNMRGIDGIIIEFDSDSGTTPFIVQSPAGGWWDQVDDLAWENGRMEITFADHWDEWDTYRTQYAMHLVIGNWVDHIGPENVTGAWLVGDVFPDPEFEPGDEDPVLSPPTDFEGGGHWGWSMRFGSLPWNMSEITKLVMEWNIDEADVAFIVQSPGGGWWDQKDFSIVDGTLEIVFADHWDDWDDYLTYYEMHLVFGGWQDHISPANVTSSQLFGVVAEGVPNPEAGEDRGWPEEGTLPYDMGPGDRIWGDQDTQLGWQGDTRAIDNNEPFAGPNGEGGFSHRLLLEANWFVIYMDNAPDWDEYEEVSLMIFGAADWSWGENKFYAPTMLIWDADLSALVFPLSAHQYIAEAKAADIDPENRNFGICFDYEGGSLDSLGITSAWLYVDRPEGGAPPAPEPPAPEPPAPEPPPPAPTPAPAATDEGGMPWWAWALIAVGVAAVAIIIVVVVKKKK